MFLSTPRVENKTPAQNSALNFLGNWYNPPMTSKQTTKLNKAYSKYRKSTKNKSILSYFRAFTPEIIFRTTKLEGEKVTRRMVSALFK